MTGFDLAVVALAALAGAAGHGLGLVRRTCSLAGALAGLVAGAWVLPGLLDDLGARTARPAAAVGLVGLAGLGHWAGMAVGTRLAARPGTARRVWHRVSERDRLAGALAGIAGVFAATWLLAPVVAAVPGWPARQARSSAVAGALDAVLPPPPDALGALRRVVRASPAPEVFGPLHPAADPGPVPAASPVPEPVLGAARAATVALRAEGCAPARRGTAFVVAPGVAVTAAHVVAGESRLEALDASGTARAATVVAFDAGSDLALVAVPGLSAAPVALTDAGPGAAGSVLGHPGGGALRAAPFRLAEEREARGRDLSGDRTTRRVLVLAAELGRGDSGGPLVTASGVVGVAFAVAPDRAGTAYALPARLVRGLLAAPRPDAADTGRCP